MWSSWRQWRHLLYDISQLFVIKCVNSTKLVGTWESSGVSWVCKLSKAWVGCSGVRIERIGVRGLSASASIGSADSPRPQVYCHYESADWPRPQLYCDYGYTKSCTQYTCKRAKSKCRVLCNIQSAKIKSNAALHSARLSGLYSTSFSLSVSGAVRFILSAVVYVAVQ